MLSSVTTAIILAGGKGTRLRSAVPDLPKPMAPVRGRPFLAHQMDYWIDQGITRFVLSVGYKKELIMDHFGPSYNEANIDYAIEENPLGTGGGLMLAAQDICEPALVLKQYSYRRPLRESDNRILDDSGEFFLNASWTSRSDFT